MAGNERQGKPTTAAHSTPRNPASLEALVAQAHQELRAGRLVEAEAAYRKVVALRPDIAEAHFSLGSALLTQGKVSEAAAHFEQALTLRADYADAHYNLACALKQQGKLEQAVAHFEQAIALRPDDAAAHFNLGNTLKQQDQLDRAVAQFEQAIALRPHDARSLINLGLALRDQLKLPEARQALERARSIEPASTDALLGLASCYLIEGDYERGWPLFEARLRVPGFLPTLNLPRWQGEPLAGRRLLLVAEQGLGDTIQFMRYARLLKERGARVVLAVQPALGRLLSAHADFDELFLLGSDAAIARCDYYLPLLSAPGALGTTASTIPRDVPYLTADRELTESWRRKLAAIEGFKIGIAWQGAREFGLDRWRSLPLAHFVPLASLPGVRLVSLQKGFGSEQIAAVDFPVVDLSGELDEAAGAFMDTAAVMRNLDLVVTSDTAIPHLAGALGVPVWVTLSFSPDWRFLLQREDSPWYPTMRLFRQTRFGEWSGVFQRIALAVETHRRGEDQTR